MSLCYTWNKCLCGFLNIWHRSIEIAHTHTRSHSKVLCRYVCMCVCARRWLHKPGYWGKRGYYVALIVWSNSCTDLLCVTSYIVLMTPMLLLCAMSVRVAIGGFGDVCIRVHSEARHFLSTNHRECFSSQLEAGGHLSTFSSSLWPPWPTYSRHKHTEL